ncbi:MAG: adenylate/guanylate cyclase domain-containing protein [bacterium]|nr:adenylate/guanylate cyclase domain-containing protein [bacterium]
MSEENVSHNSSARLSAIVKRVNDLTELLRSQRELLRQKGVNLPAGALDNLRSLKARLDALLRQVDNSKVELQRLRALAETTALINSSRDTDSVLNQVMDTVINLTGAERGYIVLKNRATGEFDQFRVARGIDSSQLAFNGSDEANSGGKRNELIVSKTIVNEVAETGQAVITDNASNDERYRDQQSIVGFALRSILAVPLKVRDEVIGVVYCDNRIMAGLFQPGDLDIMNAFSNQAGVAIENARLFELARQQLDQVTAVRDLMDNVFDSISSGVITVNSHMVVTACNATACDILNIADENDAVNEALKRILPPIPADFYDAITQTQRDGIVKTLEYKVPLGETHRNWSVTISQLRDEQSTVQGAVLVVDDLTEQRELELRLKQLRVYLPAPLLDKITDMSLIETGQEREITSISIDVRDFTKFSELLPPEQLMETINKYLSLGSDGINLYEGIVDKYMGDALTGLYNTQLNPQKDHALRALRAAMSIIYDLYALHEVVPENERLYYGIGIHTGQAFLGNIGSPDRQEFSALGEAVTISKILESNAKPGEVIISETTYELVKDDFECERVVLEKTKGYPNLTHGYKVIKRKKGKNTGSLFLDAELEELLKDI